MKLPTLTQILLTYAFDHTVDAAIALLNAEAQNDRPQINKILAAIFRHRAARDLAWMQQTLRLHAADLQPLDPHIGPVGPFPPFGMSWTAYAACLETADDATWALESMPEAKAKEVAAERASIVAAPPRPPAKRVAAKRPAMAGVGLFG